VIEYIMSSAQLTILCVFQVKGLSIEHEKLAVVQGNEGLSNSHDKMESSNGRKISRLKEVADSLNNNCGAESALLQQRQDSQLASPTSMSYSPVMSPYMHPHFRPYDQRGPTSAPPHSAPQGYVLYLHFRLFARTRCQSGYSHAGPSVTARL